MIIYGKNTRFSINDYGMDYIKITDTQGRELETTIMDNVTCDDILKLYRMISHANLTWCEIVDVLAHKHIDYDFVN